MEGTRIRDSAEVVIGCLLSEVAGSQDVSEQVEGSSYQSWWDWLKRDVMREWTRG